MMKHISPKAARSCHLAIGIGVRWHTPLGIAHWMPRLSRARHIMGINGGIIHSRWRLLSVVVIDARGGVSLYCNDIILLHRRVMDAWENRRTQQSGPSVDRILEKGLPVFPKLDTLEVSATVDFYDSYIKHRRCSFSH
jgi:hypothetical protein